MAAARGARARGRRCCSATLLGLRHGAAAPQLRRGVPRHGAIGVHWCIRAYHGLPFLLAAAFALIAALPHNAPGAAVAAFCLAGLGCSALLPLTISFGQEKLASYETAVAGGVIACYQGGYGVAAFGVGPLVSAGVRVPEIFAASAVVAGLMGFFSFVVARAGHRPRPCTPALLSHALPYSRELSAARWICAAAPLNRFHPGYASRSCNTWIALASFPARQGQQRSLVRIFQVSAATVPEARMLSSCAWCRASRRTWRR